MHLRLVSRLLFFVMPIALNAQTVVPLYGVEGQSENQNLLAMRGTSKTSAKHAVVFPGDNVLPHIVDGGSWSSSITLTNLGSKRAHVRLLFISDDGKDWFMPIAGQGTVRGIDLTLDPTVTLTFDTGGTSAQTTTGWIYMMKDAFDDAVTGLCVFRQRASGRPDFEAVVPIVSEFEDRGVLLFDNTQAFVTAAAFTNPSSSIASVDLIVRAENGVILERKTISLPPYAHTAGTVPATFPSSANRRGSIEYITRNTLGLSAIGFRFNPGGAFTTFQSLTNLDWVLK